MRVQKALPLNLPLSDWLKAVDEVPMVSPTEREILKLRLSGENFYDIAAAVDRDRKTCSTIFYKLLPNVEVMAIKLSQ